jgi:hypothetical protein
MGVPNVMSDEKMLLQKATELRAGWSTSVMQPSLLRGGGRMWLEVCQPPAALRKSLSDELDDSTKTQTQCTAIMQYVNNIKIYLFDMSNSLKSCPLP